MADTKQKDGPANIKIGVRRETRQKYEAIRKVKRWTFVETADVLADEFIAREGITVPVKQPQQSRRRQRVA